MPDGDYSGTISTAPSTPPTADGNPCFPSSSTVTLANGTVARLSSLREGDAILAATIGGTLMHDSLTLLSIAQPNAGHIPFLTIGTDCGATLTLTPTHHLPVGISCCSSLVKAQDVTVGQTVWSTRPRGGSKWPIASEDPEIASEGHEKAIEHLAPCTVTSVGETTSSGLHSPVLANGGMPVVDGVATSFDTLATVTLATHGLSFAIRACKATGTCAIFQRLASAHLT
uniref:Hedgehog protein Hint domain-containing protein n=1 Tax=Haptolina brevifila TaxID=156173 RepID=A0A7S2J6N5_9EUKA